ncbi:tubulin-specific chaperone A [Culicoides brevitarsis]|uniref:tubulin-specific chaperone A n=1 Tax=Culicoides brevitarsis TaxID=469753 RepID=UPI00307BB31D
MTDPRLKQIKIKAGVVKRCTKDVTSYEKEANVQQGKVEKLKSEGKDEHDIRKQEEVLQECLMMIPDSKRRLRKCYEELTNILEGEKELEEAEEYKLAVTIAEEAKAQLEQE